MMAAAQQDRTKYPVGFRFNPFDHELIDDYLKPEIRKPRIMKNEDPCSFIKHKQVYGPCSNPWYIFDSDDWFRSPDHKLTEKSVYVFAKLTKVSKSNGSTWKNTSKKAGCGTWAGKGKHDQIFDCKGNLIGVKKYLVYEINDVNSLEDGFDLKKVGQYKMHEYSLSGDNADLNFAGAYAIVLCRITHDSSKECTINLKSGTKAAGKVSRSRSEVANVKEENTYNNVEGTSIVTTENLTVLGSGVAPVGECSVAVQFNNDALELGDSRSGREVANVKEGNIYNNVEGTSIVTTENLTVLGSGVAPVGECSVAVQFNNDALELGDSRSGREVANVKEENTYNNVEGTSIVTTENLTVLGSGVAPVGECSVAVQFNNDALELGDSRSGREVANVKEGNIYNNVEGTSIVTTENLTMPGSGVGPVGECSAAVQFNNDALELGDFCESLDFDDLGGNFRFDDLGGDFSFDDLGNCDVSWFMESLDSDQQQEEPSQDNSGSQLKRKSESDEDLFHSKKKKMCLNNTN